MSSELPWRRNLIVSVFGSFTSIIALTLMLPFLPLYVARLGETDHAAILRWSGIAYAASFFTAAIVAPFWGILGDRYGRKLMQVRASLGVAVCTALLAVVQDVHQLVALRLLTGLVAGYASGATVLVATQTPRQHLGWALGWLASGAMAGNLAGPLIGGALPALVGFQATFYAVGGVVFLTFLATAVLIKEERRPAAPKPGAVGEGTGKGTGWSSVPRKLPVIAMLCTGMLLLFAIMSIEPILAVYVGRFVEPDRVTIVSGIVMAAGAFGSVLTASRLGKLADRIGHWTVITACMSVSAVLLIPQAFVTAAWQLVALRFAMGLALGGLLPCIAVVIRNSVPDRVAGRMLGYSVSAQFAGHVAGPVTGGFIGGHFGMPAVFLGTAAVMALGAAGNWIAKSSLASGHPEQD